MIESLEELKAIRDGAPKGAKFITDNGCYSDGIYYNDGFSWLRVESSTTMRSLSDINRIIDLTEVLLLINDLSLLTGDEGIQKQVDNLLTERNE